MVEQVGGVQNTSTEVVTSDNPYSDLGLTEIFNGLIEGTLSASNEVIDALALELEALTERLEVLSGIQDIFASVFEDNPDATIDDLLGELSDEQVVSLAEELGIDTSEFTDENGVLTDRAGLEQAISDDQGGDATALNQSLQTIVQSLTAEVLEVETEVTLLIELQSDVYSALTRILQLYNEAANGIAANT